MRGVDHLLTPIPLPRKLFIVEVGDGSAAVAEHFGDLLIEFEMRMHHDPRRAERILAVLPNTTTPSTASLLVPSVTASAMVG